MLKFITSLFDDNAKDIKKYSKIVEQINSFEPQISALSDIQLQAKTPEFKERLANGETLNEILPEAFAVVREASKRVLNMRHFDVQLIGGIVLHDGRIAEMKTGEGKTLVATAPVYLNALEGKGVHVITVNDYLATRDSQWMGKLYNFLGLSVGLVVHGLEYDEKRAAYEADITYGTNNEFGFDYLRDNMAVQPSNIMQKNLNFCIVDEVDSILIDEARTPLIISGPSAKPTEIYYQATKIIPRLKAEDDYTIDEKLRVVTLTEDGVSKVEQMMGLENLYDNKNIEASHHINQALRAHVLYKKDRDYVVKDGEVIIVDEFTGRLMFGRRYSEGLHQAIEAKENVQIGRESQTLATITFQNYFRMYNKLAGMTGTAKTEEEEFRKIYHFDVVEVPTNLPLSREDMPDVVYRTEQGKFKAVVEEIKEQYQIGAPVLVGTISIEKSEELSDMLKKEGIPHQVLNAKFHDKEAEIIAQAGRFKTVTIATNMAGRGTDILLGGNPDTMATAELKGKKAETASPQELAAIKEKYQQQTDAEKAQVLAAGGLHILGTERHESRRIDNQLRGRAGRQGDPGVSRFYISMEDDLMRRFGADNITGLMDKIGMDDDMPIDAGIISKSIETAQKRVENRNFDIRKNVLEYDDVMNQQREIIYKQRRDVLNGENLKENVIGILKDTIERTIAPFMTQSKFVEEWDLPNFIETTLMFLPERLDADTIKQLAPEELKENIIEQVLTFYANKEQRLGEEQLRQLERAVILQTVDNKWMGHLDAMDQLRQGIGLRAYGQRNPLIEYKNEAFMMFQQMIEEIQDDVTRLVLRAELVAAPTERKQMVENRGDQTPQPKKPVHKKPEDNIGRNDLCPCGSGKKYKKCCGQHQQ